MHLPVTAISTLKVALRSGVVDPNRSGSRWRRKSWERRPDHRFRHAVHFSPPGAFRHSPRPGSFGCTVVRTPGAGSRSRWRPWCDTIDSAPATPAAESCAEGRRWSRVSRAAERRAAHALPRAQERPTMPLPCITLSKILVHGWIATSVIMGVVWVRR